MKSHKKSSSENILLLIIAVTLLAVKLSDAAMVVKNQSASPVTVQQNNEKSIGANTPLKDTVKSEKKPTVTVEKKTFTFTLVDLNRFTAEDLLQLDGVGPVLAERIVAYRKQHGRIGKISELRHVKGIGIKKYAAIMKQYR